MAAPAEMVAKLAVSLKNGCPLASPPAPEVDTTSVQATAPTIAFSVAVIYGAEAFGPRVMR